MVSFRGRVPELNPPSSLCHLFGVFLPVFLWPIILMCLVHSSYLVYLRILPCMCTHLLAKMGSTTYGQNAHWHCSPFDLRGAFLCTCGVGGLLTSEMRNVWAGLGLLRQLSCYSFSWRSLQEMNLQGRFNQGSPSTSCHSLNIKVKSSQSCPTLCDPMNYTVHGILQARKLEWVGFPFSRGSSQPRNRTQVSIVADRFFPS